MREGSFPLPSSQQLWKLCAPTTHLYVCFLCVCVFFQQVMRHTNSKVDVNPIFICFSKGHSFTLIISILYLPRRLAFHFSLLYLSFFHYVSSVLRLLCLSLDPRCLIFFWFFFFFFVFIISLFPKDIRFILLLLLAVGGRIKDIALCVIV